MLGSMKNPQIKNIIALQNKPKERAKQQAFIVEGQKMIEEISAEDLIKVYVSETYPIDKYHKLSEMPYEIIKASIFEQISATKTPQGILAIVRQKISRLEDFIHIEKPMFVLLEDIQDPGNLGTILRSAEGAGVHGVFLTKGCVDRYNPKVIRSTMGAIFRVPCIVIEEPLEELLIILKNHGIRLIAAHLKGTQIYDKEVYTEGTAFLIGNESQGLKDETADICDMWVKIPLLGQVESLNASVAASLLMYESARQRRNQ